MKKQCNRLFIPPRGGSNAKADYTNIETSEDIPKQGATGPYKNEKHQNHE